MDFDVHNLNCEDNAYDVGRAVIARPNQQLVMQFQLR